MTSMFVINSYIFVPTGVIFLMYLELDPTSCICRHVFSQYTSYNTGYLTIFLLDLMCYAVNVVGTYNCTLLISYASSGAIYILHCGFTVLKTCPLFLTRVDKLYDLNVLIVWFKCGQISHNIAERLTRNSMLLAVVGGNIGVCSITFSLIRLNHQLKPILVASGWVGFICVGIMAKICWGIITMVHSETEYGLHALIKLRVIRKIKTIWERKVHMKIVKAMKPIAFPVGFGDFTFFRVKKSNELVFATIIVNNTISLLLL